MTRVITVNVTAEQIAAAGDDRMKWAVPMEAAIAAIAGVEVSIDGDSEFGCVATIGTTDLATLVLDLPEAANGFLDRRWAGHRASSTNAISQSGRTNARLNGSPRP